MSTTSTTLASELEFSEEEVPEVKRAVRDEIFYFDKYVVFKVENTLFRVPEDGFLVPGNTLESIFSPSEPGDGSISPREGLDDDHPIIMEGISVDYFRGFLKVMYPNKEVSPTYQDWKRALHLSTQWCFPVIRKRCIDALSAILPDKDVYHGDIIQLGLQYRVKDWFINGCVALVKQPTSLDISMLCESNLDLLIMTKLLSIREGVYQKTPDRPISSPEM
ncbi:hypothetical protein CVT25_002789 [Psilocybe cyanescens]|uniref:BTB domain-containing protein n=1 Tax=Psilocybe cyanescens TaxID=93625 RepID=A0A409WL12_PSICY|nr:hypothetical protein CVT25_002789 [Psilocybe cyanescens]